MPKSDQNQAINGDFKGKDILSLDQFQKEDVDLLFSNVPEIKKLTADSKPCDLLKGKLVTLLFFEPSSRTFSSFSAAVKRLGGATLDMQNPAEVTSVVKGETFSDTIKVFESYSDAIVIRTKVPGQPQEAANAAFFVPIINAGDGIGEHPTQALLDMYTLKEKFGKLENLTGVITGDLLNGRTVHSLLAGLSLYKNNTIYLLSPQSLKLSKNDFEKFSKRGIKLIEIASEKDMPKDANFWYWTRVQKERFENLEEYEKTKHAFVLTKSLLEERGNSDMVIMHPLPRVGEISEDIDEDPRAIYLKNQVRNGLYVRMTLMVMVLGKYE